MVSLSIWIVAVLLIFSINFTSAFALTDLQRSTINEPRLEKAFGSPIGSHVNIDQQIQISVDITNNQEKSQSFVYLVQVKDEAGFVVSLGWISGQLSPNQKLSPSLSWTSDGAGEFTAEIFAWSGLKNHSALSESTALQITVS